MWNIKSGGKGLTLIEIVIAMAIFVLILFILWYFYINYYQVYNFQQAIGRGAGSASAIANEIQDSALQADKIVASHTFPDKAYNSDQNNLVLEIPSIDSSGNIVSGKYDYMVFYATGTNFYKQVQADPSSVRASSLKRLSDAVSTITFTYNNGDLSQANKIAIDMQMRSVIGHQNVPYHLHQEIYLRNF